MNQTNDSATRVEYKRHRYKVCGMNFFLLYIFTYTYNLKIGIHNDKCYLQVAPKQLYTQPDDSATVGHIYGTPVSE
jgi:hypothetical protein